MKRRLGFGVLAILAVVAIVAVGFVLSGEYAGAWGPNAESDTVESRIEPALTATGVHERWDTVG